MGVLVLSNIFDVLQKFKAIYIPSDLFWKLVLYKVPYLINEVSTLISFISMMLFLIRLIKYNELLTILGSGIPIWRVLIIPVVAALLLGALVLIVLNPIGTYGLRKYETLEAKLTKKRHGGFLVVQQGGILLCEEYNEDNRLIMARSINVISKELKDVTILFIDSSNHFLKRIDAESAILSDNELKLKDIEVITDNDIEKYGRLTIPTGLSINNFIERFAMPEMIPVWELPSSINKFLKSGVPVINYQIYYYKQLLKPIMMVATVILACCFISLRQRDNSQNKMLVSGLVTGFVIYSLVEVALRVLASNNIQPFLAVLLPIILIILISNFVVLHFNQA
jgi:lipopolysaccharide export system permease protein